MHEKFRLPSTTILLERARDKYPKIDPTLGVLATVEPLRLTRALRRDQHAVGKARVIVARPAPEQCLVYAGYLTDVAATLADTAIIPFEDDPVPSAIESNLDSNFSLKELAESIDRVTSLRAKLARGAFALAMAPGVLGGVGGALALLDATHQEVAVAQEQGPSIIPGTQKAAIPTLPDAEGGSYEVIADENKIIFTTTQFTRYQQSRLGHRPENFSRIQAESAANITGIMPLLHYAKDNNATITAAEVNGSASDDLYIGIPEAQNADLAQKRAREGMANFKKLAQKYDIKIKQTRVVGSEKVLNPNQEAKIDALAHRLGIARFALLNEYNAQKGHFAPGVAKKSDVEVIDGLIGDARRVDYKLTLKIPEKVTQKPRAEVVKEAPKNNSWLERLAVPSAATMALGLMSGWLLHGYAAGELAHGRAKWRLRRELRAKAAM